uniref:Uncharacterized protein n=1 Tax=Panagrolaimus superbus TaxID=310955 RepID=A0A914Z8Q1_9BILA
MAKRNNKIKKNSKKGKVVVQMHDKNCKLCDNYSCLTEKVISEALEKRMEKEMVKDPSFKIQTSAIKLNNLNVSTTNSRRASLRSKKVLQSIDEEKKEEKAKEKEIKKEPLLEIPPPSIITLPCKLPSYPESGLGFFLTIKPKGVKSKLEFIKPKLPMIISSNNNNVDIKYEPTSLPLPVMNQSSHFVNVPFSTRESSSINKYSYLLKNIKHEGFT